MHFAFVFLSRAVNKAIPLLSTYNYATGDAVDDAKTNALIKQLVDTRLVKNCDAQHSFDESEMFKGPLMSAHKNDFKKHFRKISRIVDCVGCEKCKLHAKLQILGLATALKILFVPLEHVRLDRNEIIALINTLGKFSHATHMVQVMLKQQFNRKWLVRGALALIGLIVLVGFPLVIAWVVVRSRCIALLTLPYHLFYN